MRARPTIPTVGPTRALAIAPLRAAPAGGGEVAGEGARGRRRGRALPGTARAEGREEENKPVGKARAAAAAAAAAAVWSSPARMMPAVPARGSGR